MRVYLAGLIAGDKIKECLLWRASIVSQYRMKGSPLCDVEFISPLKGKVLDTISENGYTSSIPGKAIVAGDLMSLKSCDLLIANMDKFGVQREAIGTLSEIAIAYEAEIPVIMISSDSTYTEHPFLKHFATLVVGSVQELLDSQYIDYFSNRLTKQYL